MWLLFKGLDDDVLFNGFVCLVDILSIILRVLCDRWMGINWSCFILDRLDSDSVRSKISV